MAGHERISRTVLVQAAWYTFPTWRFVVVPFLIVALYVVSIFILERRWRAIRQQNAVASPA